MLEANTLNAEIYTILTVLFDTLLVAAMGGLWWLWWRSSQRQSQVEKLLLDATQQLDEATKNLQHAYALMQHRGQKEPLPEASKRGAVSTPQSTSPPIRKQGEKSNPNSPEDGSQLNRILRLRREGATPEAIAAEFKLPIAQIRLLLKLHER